MSFSSASQSSGVSKTYTNIELVGGYDCHPDYSCKAVDLLVQGGGRIKKSLCIEGNLNVGGLITGQLCGNIFTEKITEKESMEGIDVCGNIMMLGDIIPQIDNQYSLGGPDNKWANIYTQDLVVCGTLFANTMMDMVDGNLITANVVCVLETLQTDLIESKTPNGDICVVSNIDMKCGEIGNLQALRVDQVFGKSSPWNSEDDMNMRNGNAITFVEGIRVGNTNTIASVSSAIALGKDAQATSINVIAIGTNAVTTGNLGIAIGYSANVFGKKGIAIGPYALNGATGDFNVAIGANAISLITSASRLTAIGCYSQRDAGGNDNTSVGYKTLANNDRPYNTAMGSYAAGNSRCTACVVIGFNAMKDSFDIENYYNVVIGAKALVKQDNSSYNNVIIGAKAMENTVAQIYNNVVIGYKSMGLYSIDVGGLNYNVAVGSKALYSITFGTCNVVLGSSALESFTSGDNNTVLGCDASLTGSAGSDRIVIGNDAIGVNDRDVQLGASNAGTTGNLIFREQIVSQESWKDASVEIAVIDGEGNLRKSNQVPGDVTIEGSVIITGNLCVDSVFFVSNIEGKSPVTISDELKVDGALTVTTPINLGQFWVAGSQATSGIEQGWSEDGVTFFAASTPASLAVPGAAVYSPELGRWVQIGSSGGGALTCIAYSSNGKDWLSAINTATSMPMLGAPRYVDWSASQGLFVAVAMFFNQGGGTTSTIAYSSDGINWTEVLGTQSLFADIWGIKYSAFHDRWVIVASSGSNGLGYATDPTIIGGAGWIGGGNAIMSSARGVDVNDSTGLWVATGAGPNTVAYSANGISWIGLGTTVISIGQGIAYGIDQDLWIIVGGRSPFPTPHCFVYATDPTMIGNYIVGTAIFGTALSSSGSAFEISYSPISGRFVVSGDNENVVGFGNYYYSDDGITWIICTEWNAGNFQGRAVSAGAKSGITTAATISDGSSNEMKTITYNDTATWSYNPLGTVGVEWAGSVPETLSEAIDRIAAYVSITHAAIPL